VIGVAGGAAAGRADKWLARAREAGVDVSLITNAPPQDGAVRVRRVRRFGPLQLARALEAERQLRGQADALLVEGRVARALMRVMPGSLKGRRPPVDTGEDAAAAKSRLSKTS
jgi:hypothetical protein